MSSSLTSIRNFKEIFRVQTQFIDRKSEWLDGLHCLSKSIQNSDTLDRENGQSSGYRFEKSETSRKRAIKRGRESTNNTKRMIDKDERNIVLQTQRTKPSVPIFARRNEEER